MDRRSARPTTPVTCHDDDDHDNDRDDRDVRHNAYNVDEDGDDDTYSLSVDGVNSEKKCCNQGGARWHIEVTPVLIFVTLVSRILVINICNSCEQNIDNKHHHLMMATHHHRLTLQHGG